MRKHDVRKWLHAILDLLPVILIPVFMIYSHRHEINSGSIEVPQNVVVDFNQIVKNGNFETTAYWDANSYETFTIENGVLTVVHDYPNGRVFQNNFVTENQCYYIVKGSCSSNVDGVLTFEFSRGWVSTIVRTTANEVKDFTNLVYLNNTQTNGNRFQIYGQSDLTFNIYDLNVFNITQMFGAGNEPTIEEFDSYFTDSYYDYTLSHKELLKGFSNVVYNDTDIMSQFTYQLYNSVDKYFNVGNVFHLGEVYDWFNLNIFNGQAPLYIFIVYQIVLYELIMDLLFLLYALFMWFIDMIQKLMEKPLNSIK